MPNLELSCRRGPIRLADVHDFVAGMMGGSNAIARRREGKEEIGIGEACGSQYLRKGMEKTLLKQFWINMLYVVHFRVLVVIMLAGRPLPQ